VQHLPADGEGSRPLLLEPDAWIGTVSTNTLGAMRETQAEIRPLLDRRLRSILPKEGLAAMIYHAAPIVFRF